MTNNGHALGVFAFLLLTFAKVPVVVAIPMDQLFQVAVNKTRFINLEQNTDTVSVGNPDIADIQLLDKNHLYIVGRRLGSTNVVLGNAKAEFFMTLNVEVTHDLDGLKTKLHELIPSEHPEVHSSQNSIVLSGQISSAEKMDNILAIAGTFLQQDGKPQDSGQGAAASPPETKDKAAADAKPGKNQATAIINMMQVGGPQQVMLEVKVAEMDRTLAKNLDVNFNIMQAGGSWSAGGVSGKTAVPMPLYSASGQLTQVTESITHGQLFDTLLNSAPTVISPFGAFAKFIGQGGTQGSAVINASRQNGLVKILAEPTLTTISGQSADFLSGGEFPIPVQRNATGGISITYKEYGVATKFLPVVLDSGRISLKLTVDVSEISNLNTVVASVSSTQNAFVIPALTKRRANSSVELEDGQTIGIAGLISDNLRDSVNKLPGIGDLPILGQLFTSQQYLKNQTELVIFITPRLAKPMPNANPTLPTDSFVEPDEFDYYLRGRTESLKDKGLRPRAQEKIGAGAGGLYGTFGQQP